MKRRNFLRLPIAAGLVAGGASLFTWTQRAFSATVTANLNIVSGTVTTIDDVVLPVFGYSETQTNQFPGPSIICREGDTIALTLRNYLGTKSGFAVNGHSVNQILNPGETKQLSFAAPKAGSYLYHDPLNNGVNRLMGLHGALIVMPAGETNRSFAGAPLFIRQYKWILSNLDPLWCNAVGTNGDNFVTDPSLSINTFKPRYFTINGESYERSKNADTKVYGAYGEPALIRMLNAGAVTHSPHFHANHVIVISINRRNFDVNAQKHKDVVSMFPLDARDVIFPFDLPPDAWPPVTTAQHYPMHCHSEPSQTANGGSYPHGMHTAIDMGHTPPQEPKL